MAISLHFSYSDFCKCFCECFLRSFLCWSWGFWITWNFGFAYHSVYLRHCPIETLSCCSSWWCWSSSWSCRSLRSFRCCRHCCLSCIGCCRLCSLIPPSVSEPFWERLTCCSEKMSAESYCHSSTLPDSHRHRSTLCRCKVGGRDSRWSCFLSTNKVQCALLCEEVGIVSHDLVVSPWRDVKLCIRNMTTLWKWQTLGMHTEDHCHSSPPLEYHVRKR